MKLASITLLSTGWFSPARVTERVCVAFPPGPRLAFAIGDIVDFGDDASLDERPFDHEIVLVVQIGRNES
jgi:hypothetical protein